MRDLDVLVVGSRVEDHLDLLAIIRSLRLTAEHVSTCERAQESIRENCPPVVVCESRLRDGTWVQALAQALSRPSPPVVVVTSDHPEMELWMDVLQRGGYDALARPFDYWETARAISGAHREAMSRRLAVAS
jgi:DNA-binding NtrC family response regulator